jgi:murein DD-endopeptidase MepM/ murein hydrolase activator NlpD
MLYFYRALNLELLGLINYAYRKKRFAIQKKYVKKWMLFMKNVFSRRNFLKMSSLVLAALFLAACNGLIPPFTSTNSNYSTNSNPSSVAVTSTNTNPPPVGVTLTNSTPQIVLNSPLDDTPEVFMNTYYGAIGASVPSPQNPQGIHQGMDFVAPAGTPVKAAASGTISRITTETKTEYDGTVNTYA